MNLKHSFKMSVSALRAHKSRSFLTILGIVIGVTSVIVIVSIGSGAGNLIAGEITSLGADIIWIEPGREPEGPLDFAGSIFSNTLKDRDIEALKNKANVPDLIDIAPAISVPGSISYMGETYRPFIMGWSAEFLGEVFDIYPEEGNYFDDFSIKNNERVTVIGARVKEELFGESEAVGETVKIKGKNFKVTGVLPDKGQIFFFDIGEFVLIPYTTAGTYLMGIDYYNEVWVRVSGVDAVPAAVHDIERTLRERHGITDPDKDDFYILTQDNLLDQISTILNIVTAAVASIVAIALIVGGVGVMNVMLVSVTERTREIGLRKAVGATRRDIVLQFLIESVILTLLGGLLGVLFGVAISYAAAFAFTKIMGAPWSFAFPLGAVLLGFGVSAFVGLVFGIYPAREAAKKNPIEALRYE